METQITAGTKEIVKSFAVAVKENNFEVITSLLADAGEFQMQDAQRETIDGDKATFINWLQNALSIVEITSIDYDTCILCSMGNPVILFNNGLFPKSLKQGGVGKSMIGLMLDIQDGKIKEIKFCLSFAERENKMYMECWNVMVNDLINQGIPQDDAIQIVFNREGYGR